MKSSVSIRSVYDFLCRLAPLSLSESWDNVGLQIGSLEDKLQGVLVALDVTEAVLWEAVDHGLNSIVTHHPLIFRPIKKLDDSRAALRCVKLAAQMDLNILSFHTNLDATEGGLNDQLAKILKLQKLKPLIPSAEKQGNSKSGLGRLGQIRKTSLQDFVAQTARTLQLKNLRYVGKPGQSLQKVAVMTGSGGDFVAQALDAGADVLVTGDVKYHQALDAQADGMAIVDIGHYAGEILMLPWLASRLRSLPFIRQNRIPVLEAESGADPFQFWQKS